MRKNSIPALVLLIAAFSLSLTAQNPAFEQRRQAYNNTALQNFNRDALVIQAYESLPLNLPALDSMVTEVTSNNTADFDITKLVRIIYLSNGAYDSLILPTLDTIPFWLTKNEKLRSYWSENHWAMWNSSNWLLHERFGRPVDNQLDTRLRHYLRMKVKYGFYEFFSSVYMPYCLSGLLNLADFAQDTEIKTLATQASRRLLRELLMLTNNKGVFFPAAGRNNCGKYMQPYSQNHSNLIYLLTGMGEIPNHASAGGSFLSTTSIALDSVINSWTATLDTIYSIGHSLDSSFIINSVLSDYDRILFQWSAGGYFHPDLALESATLIDSLNMWDHKEFKPFKDLSSFGVAAAPGLAQIASSISQSSLIMGQDVAIFKNNSITLSSVQDYWKGKCGYQQFPCVANVGTAAVYTASGKVIPDWENRPEMNANIHLPYVRQKSNIALIMYRPEPMLSNFGFKDWDVALYWPDSEFDEVREEGMWLLGRQDEQYIAVLRHCKDTLNGVRACQYKAGQTWAIIVGDSSMYNTFNDFQQLVKQSEMESYWMLDSVNSTSTYFSKLIFDNDTLQYAWVRDSSFISGIAITNPGVEPFSVYPNPAGNEITLDMTDIPGSVYEIRVFNVIGEEVYFKTAENLKILKINTTGFNKGIYIITVESKEARYIRKIMIE